MTYRFTILGVPAPKGNSRQVWRIRGVSEVIQAPSKRFLAWQDVAQMQLNQIKVRCGIKAPIAVPVMVSAVFYRDRRPDVDNLQKALGDVLQHCGVLKNDRLIRRWEAEICPPGGRPRVEVTITEVA